MKKLKITQGCIQDIALSEFLLFVFQSAPAQLWSVVRLFGDITSWDVKYVPNCESENLFGSPRSASSVVVTLHKQKSSTYGQVFSHNKNV